MTAPSTFYRLSGPRPSFVLSLPDRQPSTNDEQLLQAVCVGVNEFGKEAGAKGHDIIVFGAVNEARSMVAPMGKGVIWWLWNLLALPRSHEEQLERLFLVHPSPLARFLVPPLLLVSPFIATKIIFLENTLDLSNIHGVSLHGVMLPLLTLQRDAKCLASQAGSPHWSSGLGAMVSGLLSCIPIFSFIFAKSPSSRYMPLKDQEEPLPETSWAMNENIEKLRSVILSKPCTSTEGIFRRTSNSSITPAILAVFELPNNMQPTIPWTALTEDYPLLPPKILTKLLGPSSEPIIGHELYPIIREDLPMNQIKQRISATLNEEQYGKLEIVVGLLHDLLPFESTTRMSARAFAIVLAPCLIAGPDALEDAAMCCPPGQGLPSAMLGANDKMNKAGNGTLAGLLERWILEET